MSISVIFGQDGENKIVKENSRANFACYKKSEWKFERKQIKQIVNNLKHHVTIYSKSCIPRLLGNFIFV